MCWRSYPHKGFLDIICEPWLLLQHPELDNLKTSDQNIFLEMVPKKFFFFFSTRTMPPAPHEWLMVDNLVSSGR